MSALKLVLFDCDGTLANSHIYLTHTLERAMAHVGAELLPTDVMDRFFSLPFTQFFESIKGHLTPEQVVGASDFMHHTLISERDSADKVLEPLYEGIHPLLMQLQKAGYLLGIVTNKGSHGLASILRTNGIGAYFITKQTADMTRPKPAPDMVLAALSATGAERADTVVIGDSNLDILIARNANVKSIAVAWGNSKVEDLKAYHPDALAHTPAQVPDLIAALIGKPA